MIKVSLLILFKYIKSTLLGKANFAFNFFKVIAYFSQFMIATLSFQRNFLASYHVKTFINNSLYLSFFQMKMLQMFLDTIRSTQQNGKQIHLQLRDIARTNKVYLCASRQYHFKFRPIVGLLPNFWQGAAHAYWVVLLYEKTALK